MNMRTHKITKAIIPVAGLGSRRLPITKAVEKCMLPVCNRPIIDYIVESCVAAGITEILFIVAPDHAQLKAYYESNHQLEEYLTRCKKSEALASVRNMPAGVTMRYIVQDPFGKYGTAVPVWLAREYIEPDEQFLVLMGDDFLYNPEAPGANILNMMEAVTGSGSGSALVGVEMDDRSISRYSAVETTEQNGYDWFTRLVEKPAPGTAKSNLANVSKYLFDYKIFQYLEPVMAKSNEHGEHFLTDAVNAYVAAGNGLVVVPAQGKYLDGGSLAEWVEANTFIFQDLMTRSRL